jgi:hypothetical protein
VAELGAAELERLRASGIRLDREARFWHEGEVVTHPGLVAALWRWLAREPDGRYSLRLDARRFVYLDVDDVPYLVRSLRWDGDRAVGVLGDGSELPLPLATLRLAPSGEAYVELRPRLEARLTSTAFATLGERMVERDGEVWLEAAGGPYRVTPAARSAATSSTE